MRISSRRSTECTSSRPPLGWACFSYQVLRTSPGPPSLTCTVVWCIIFFVINLTQSRARGGKSGVGVLLHLLLVQCLARFVASTGSLTDRISPMEHFFPSNEAIFPLHLLSRSPKKLSSFEGGEGAEKKKGVIIFSVKARKPSMLIIGPSSSYSFICHALIFRNGKKSPLTTQFSYPHHPSFLLSHPPIPFVYLPFSHMKILLHLSFQFTLKRLDPLSSHK